MAHYDAIIIGAGAGGGITAGILSEAGKRVLLLERGNHLTFEQEKRDHLRNMRLSKYGVNAGPNLEDHPRVFEDKHGPRTVRATDGDYHNNAAVVGSGTRVYEGQAWRFMPQDFNMASIYGVPEGSSLMDWPINYKDLEPYYERAEWEVGVSGQADTMKHLPPYKKDYPMPRFSPNAAEKHFVKGAESLGWHTFPVPHLISSVDYHGRKACIRCEQCVGFVCPVDAKNGAHNTMIRRALDSGNCTLVTEVMVERIMTDAAGRVTGVSYFDSNDVQHQVTSEIVVVSAGAIETARVLLNSANSHEPTGLGNGGDQVGRNLQGHYYPDTIGLFPDVMWDGMGPGPVIATCEFNHGNDGIVGGGMMTGGLVETPMTIIKRLLPPDLPRWGIAHKQFLRDNFVKISRVHGPVQEIPSPDARVQVDQNVRDRWGIPVAHLSGTTHPETVRTSAFMYERTAEWMKAAGAVKIWGHPPQLRLSGGQHQAGTCRMGDDPAQSVTNSWGQVHNHDNLFIADGSLHVTNGGFNPSLTIMALAFRVSEGILRDW